MNLSLRVLLAGVIDYAGLFPPAALEMTTAVRNYAADLESEHAWILGRFVIPVERLNEFERAIENCRRPDHLSGASDRTWRLSALSGSNLEADLEKIADFNRRNARRAVIDTIEIKAGRETGIENEAGSIPSSLNVFFEIPILHLKSADLSVQVTASAVAGVKRDFKLGIRRLVNAQIAPIKHSSKIAWIGTAARSRKRGTVIRTARTGIISPETMSERTSLSRFTLTHVRPPARGFEAGRADLHRLAPASAAMASRETVINAKR